MSTSINRRAFQRIAIGATAGACLPQAWANPAYPQRPIKIIVPYSAGAVTDMLGRLVARSLQERLQATVIVDNRVGAGGTLGTSVAAKSAPDGYTLLLGATGPISVGKALYPQLNYEPATDLVPVAVLSRVPFVIVANPKRDLNSVEALLAAAKAKPGFITYGSAGNGTPQHIIGEMFKQATQASLTHIPYKGSAPATADLLGNQIAVMFDNPGPLVQHIKAKKLVVLAQTGATRLPAFPKVATMQELGYPDFVATPWYGIMAPKGVPDEILQKLNADINHALGQPEVVATLNDAGLAPSPMSLSDAGKFLANEAVRWGEAARRSNSTID